MCLASPAKILKLEKGSALAEFGGGVKKRIKTDLLVENVKVGEYVLVHAGYAIEKIRE